MKTTTFFLNFSLLIIYTKSLENSTISTSTSTSTSTTTTTSTSTLKSTNITDSENSNITTSTMQIMTLAQLPVDVLSGDILLDPNIFLARAIRNSEDIFPSRAKKNNIKKINTNPRNKRYSNYTFLESDIIPHFLFDRPRRRIDKIKRSYTKIYPVFHGK